MELIRFPQPPRLSLFEEFLPLHLPDLNQLGSMRYSCPYPVTNEKDDALTYAKLGKISAVANSVITLSGWQGIEQFAAISSERVRFLFHIDPQSEQKILWALFISSIHQTNNPQDAISTILQRVRYVFDQKVVAKLTAYFSSPDLPFTRQAGWYKIKRAVNDGGVFSLYLDLANQKKVKNFCDALIKGGFSIHSMYLSNLMGEEWLGKQYISQELMPLFYSVNYRTSSGIYLIFASFPKKCCTKRLQQRIVYVSNYEPASFEVICHRGKDHALWCLALIRKIAATVSLKEDELYYWQKKQKIEQLIGESGRFAHYLRNHLNFILQALSLSDKTIEGYMGNDFPYIVEAYQANKAKKGAFSLFSLCCCFWSHSQRPLFLFTLNTLCNQAKAYIEKQPDNIKMLSDGWFAI